MKLGAAELRTTKASDVDLARLKRNPVYIILDSVLDTYNVGAIFRLADAVSAEKVILCGLTETPPHTRIKKASINTTEWVSWEYHQNISEAIEILRKTVPDIKIVAIEQDKKAVQYDKAQYELPIALIVGHETEGVSKDALQLSDMIVEIPMWGINKSLNVMVSLGIVLYKIMEHHK